MRTWLLSAQFFLIQFISAQSGYVEIGLSYLGGKELNNRTGVHTSAGFSKEDNLTFGFGADVYMLEKEKFNFLVIFLDARVYFKKLMKKPTPYLAMEPGWVATSGTTLEGKFAGTIAVGLQLKPKNSIGVNISVGYSTISFRNIIVPSRVSPQNDCVRLTVSFAI